MLATQHVIVKTAGATLHGQLRVPRRMRAIIMFAQSGDDSDDAPADGFVGHSLNRAGLGTLMVSLLTARERADDLKRCDITLLARRLVGLTDWIRALPGISRYPIGYHGTSTGAAATMIAAAQRAGDVFAVVSRDGRPDLATSILRYVRAPTRIIVDGYDELVVELNRSVYETLDSEKDLRIVGGGEFHLDDEPARLEETSFLSADWFLRHLASEHAVARAW